MHGRNGADVLGKEREQRSGMSNQQQKCRFALQPSKRPKPGPCWTAPGQSRAEACATSGEAGAIVLSPPGQVWR